MNRLRKRMILHTVKTRHIKKGKDGLFRFVISQEEQDQAQRLYDYIERIKKHRIGKCYHIGAIDEEKGFPHGLIVCTTFAIDFGYTFVPCNVCPECDEDVNDLRLVQLTNENS